MADDWSDRRRDEDADAGWGADFGPRSVSRRPPTWMWAGCGGCALGIAIAVSAAILWAGRLRAWVAELEDVDKQWTELAEVLPYEARPSYELQRLPWPPQIGGLKIWRIADPASDLGGVVVTGSEKVAAEHLQGMLSEDAPTDFSQTARHELESGTVEIQGRARACLRFQREPAEPSAEAKQSPLAVDLAGGARGAGLAVDVALSEARPAVLQLVRRNSREPISEAELAAFLAPFDLDGER